MHYLQPTDELKVNNIAPRRRVPAIRTIARTIIVSMGVVIVGFLGWLAAGNTHMKQAEFVWPWLTTHSGALAVYVGLAELITALAAVFVIVFLSIWLFDKAEWL